jgi:Ca2+-dependent lipid-binding protein
MVLGTVIIKPKSALLTSSKDVFDKVDAYVKVYFNNDHYKTDVAKNQGANPFWNNEFCFKNVDLEKNVIRFEVFDKNLISDHNIGCCEYALANLLQVQNHFCGGLLLLRKGLSAGTLNLDIQFIQEGILNQGQQLGQQQAFQQTTLGSGGIGYSSGQGMGS